MACPREGCRAARGDPCVYAQVSEHRPYSKAALERAERVGTPTKKPHYERSNRLNELEWAAQQRALHKRRLQEGITETPPALFALRDFDLAEQRRLKEWLRANWRLFLLRKVDGRG